MHHTEDKGNYNSTEIEKEKKEQKDLRACVSAVASSLTTMSKSLPQRTRRAGVMCTADNGTPK